jgi:hypothetical protein
MADPTRSDAKSRSKKSPRPPPERGRSSGGSRKAERLAEPPHPPARSDAKSRSKKSPLPPPERVRQSGGSRKAEQLAEPPHQPTRSDAKSRSNKSTQPALERARQLGGSRTTEQLVEPPHHVPQKWVFGLAAAVVLACLGSVVLWSFTVAPQLQYPIVLGFLCFALSTVSGLLFASHTKVDATLPIAAITIGGPAVTWVATLLIFSYIFPLPAITSQSFVDTLRSQQLREGWRLFPDWVKELGALRPVVERDEASQVRQVMDSTYYTGTGRHKISFPVIQSLFVFFEDKGALKIQHITGSKGDVAEVYFKGHTTQGGSAKSLLLVKNKDVITLSDTGSKSDWIEVRSEFLDCLIMTFYEDAPVTPEGDFIFINTPKYLESGTASLDVGILAAQSIDDPKAWLFRGFPYPLHDEVPVVFKRVYVPWDHHADSVMSKLSDWLALIDRPNIGGRISDEALKYLAAVRGRLPGSSFSTFHQSSVFKSRYGVHYDQVADAVAIAFEQR